MKATIKNWKWNFAAGFVPLTAGFVMLITSIISHSNPDSKWNLILAKLDFSYNDVAGVSNDAGAFLNLLDDLTYVNIIIGAFSVIMVARYALKYKEKWAWWYMLVALVWLGFNDAHTLYIFFTKTGAPFLFMPFAFTILMAIGVITTRKEIFD